MRVQDAIVTGLVAVALVAGTAACAAAQAVPTPSAHARSVPAQSLSTPSLTAPSVPASSAQATAAWGSPSEFTGHIACGPPVRAETSTQAGDHRELRGGAWTPTATEMSDPRLDGDFTVSFDSDAHPVPESAKYTIGSETWRIETEEGTWEASSTVLGFPDGSWSRITTPLIGDGGYDGLVAVWESHYLGDAACMDVRGVIFPGPPDPPTAP